MRYSPTEGRVIVFQERTTKVGSIFLAADASEKSVYAVVKCVSDNSKFKEGQKVFFDRSSGSIISDTDDGIWSVVEEDDILALVEDE